jgi:hypothetical protein
MAHSPQLSRCLLTDGLCEHQRSRRSSLNTKWSWLHWRSWLPRKGQSQLLEQVAGCNRLLIAQGKRLWHREQARHVWRLYSRAVELTTSLDLKPINLPLVRKPSNRYVGPANSRTPSSAEEFFRVQFSLLRKVCFRNQHIKMNVVVTQAILDFCNMELFQGGKCREQMYAQWVQD